MIAYADASGDLSTLWGWKGWAICALILIAALVWRVEAANTITPTLAEPDHCTSPDCTEPVLVHLSVGDEWVGLCAGHGIPLLTEGMAR